MKCGDLSKIPLLGIRSGVGKKGAEDTGGVGAASAEGREKVGIANSKSEEKLNHSLSDYYPLENGSSSKCAWHGILGDILIE